jgi:hypothetical protein
MVTGQAPFRGPSAEVMYKHQHAPLPRERLKDVPQPVVALLEKLLEKDPAERFQTPNGARVGPPKAIVGQGNGKRYPILCPVLTSISSTGHPGKERALITPLTGTTSLQSLPGRASGSPRSLTIGSGGWLLKGIVLRNWYSAGLFTDRAQVGRLRLQMNFLMPLFTGLAIQTHGWEQHGRRAKFWPKRDSASGSSSHVQNSPVNRPGASFV